MQYLFNMGYKAIITEKDKSFPVFFPLYDKQHVAF